MNEFREMRREGRRWWAWGLGLLVITVVVLSVLGYFGIVGRTIVERKVFERSFQYSEARKTEIATFEAQLTEIERKLAAPSTVEATRTNLEAQAAAIRILLRVAREKSN